MSRRTIFVGAEPKEARWVKEAMALHPRDRLRHQSPIVIPKVGLRIEQRMYSCMHDGANVIAAEARSTVAGLAPAPGSSCCHGYRDMVRDTIIICRRFNDLT